MTFAPAEPVRIAYGAQSYAPGLNAVFAVSGQPLRLNNSPYQFDELTIVPRAGTPAERLAFLRDYHVELCDAYARSQRRFVELYFQFIGRVIADARPELEQRAATFGGLFSWEDFAFSALRPLPQAHLPLGREPVRADFAFWTGERLIAVDIEAGTRSAAWAERHRALTNAGVQTIDIPAAALFKTDPATLRDLLTPEFVTFWQTETIPASPFKPTSLGEIASEEPGF